MSRGRRLNLGGGGGHGEGDDLMITPLLDLFVALIPFLIVSLVMARINVIDVGVSKPVKTLTQATTDVPFDLLVKILGKRVEILLNGKVVKTVDRTPAASAKAPEAWVDTVRGALVDVKRKYPDQYKVRVEPEAKVTLQTLMVFMDSARKLKPEDGDIQGKDPKGQPVKLQFLFPNVILRGIYG